MNRGPIVTAIAIGLGLYGIYIASFVPGLLVGPPIPLMIVGFVAQAVAGVLGAVGVWMGATWAPIAIVVLGAAIAFTSLSEAFLLGIVSYDHALAVSFVGLLITVLIAMYLRGRTRSAFART
jgi:hypothetical protein